MRRKETVMFVIAQDKSGKAELSVCCKPQGFQLILHCPDGFSQAFSQIFPWHEIAEAIYRDNPDMFGILDEPLHFIFPQTMELLGYGVPSWRIREVRQELGYCWLDEDYTEKFQKTTKPAQEIEEMLKWITDKEGNGSRDNRN